MQFLAIIFNAFNYIYLIFEIYAFNIGILSSNSKNISYLFSFNSAQVILFCKFLHYFQFDMTFWSSKMVKLGWYFLFNLVLYGIIFLFLRLEINTKIYWNTSIRCVNKNLYLCVLLIKQRFPQRNISPCLWNHFCIRIINNMSSEIFVQLFSKNALWRKYFSQTYIFIGKTPRSQVVLLPQSKSLNWWD